MIRPDFNQHIFDIIDNVAKRSTCLRRQVGAVAVREGRIIATGFNGAPSKVKHCTDIGSCLRETLKVPSGERHELCRGVHAEQNVIIQAAKNGVELNGTVLYCNVKPCIICAKMIINVGIQTVIYTDDYNDAGEVEDMMSCKVQLIRFVRS